MVKYSRPRKTKYPRKSKKTRRVKRKVAKITNLWPRYKLVKLAMVLRPGLSGTTGAIGVYTVKANSLNDPTGSMSAQLPIGVDQLSALYSKYKIVSSRITLIGHPVDITGAAVMGIHLADNTTALTNCDHYRELPLTASRIVSPDIDIAKCSLGFNAKKFFHVAQLKDADELEGTFSTTPGDPSKLAYWHVFVQDHNSTESIGVEATIRVEYTVLLYGRIDPARSSL